MKNLFNVFTILLFASNAALAQTNSPTEMQKVCADFKSKHICAQYEPKVIGQYNYFNFVFFGVWVEQNNRRSLVSPEEGDGGKAICERLIRALPTAPDRNELFAGDPIFKPLKVGGFGRDIIDQVKVNQAARYVYKKFPSECRNSRMQSACFKKRWQLESLSCGYFVQDHSERVLETE